MGREIEISFERGGTFGAELLEHLAPETCQAVWDALPLAEPVLHGAFSGQVFFCDLPFRFSKIENPYVLGVSPGDLFLSAHPLPITLSVIAETTDDVRVPNEILVAYGTKVLFWHWAGWAPMNHFGRVISSNLPELEEIGKRLRRQGMEKMTIRRA